MFSVWCVNIFRKDTKPLPLSFTSYFTFVSALFAFSLLSHAVIFFLLQYTLSLFLPLAPHFLHAPLSRSFIALPPPLSYSHLFLLLLCVLPHSLSSPLLLHPLCTTPLLLPAPSRRRQGHCVRKPLALWGWNVAPEEKKRTTKQCLAVPARRLPGVGRAEGHNMHFVAVSHLLVFLLDNLKLKVVHLSVFSVRRKSICI